MWWALGIGIWAMLLLVAWALCRVGGDADLRMAKAHRKMLKQRMPDASRAEHQDDAA
jgi:hypothetical protein